MTTSATGGYLVQTEVALPGGLTLIRYIQQVIVGMTSMSGTLVRPKWQKNPPKVLPDPEDNWCAFRVTTTKPDASAFHKIKDTGDGSVLQRHVELTVACSFYGSDCEKNAGNLRDGFEINQNRDALRAAKMGFKEIGEAVYVPELHGQLWFPRCDITFVLRRQVDKNFSVLSFEGAEGTIEAQKSNDETENVQWNVSEQ
jgi:hypothetical protein